MENLFIHFLNMSITAAWIALAVIVLRFILKKAPKWIMGILWGFVALRLICPFSLESVFSLIPGTETVPQDILYASSPSINSGVTLINQAINPVLSAALSPSAAGSINPTQVITYIASIIWIVGIIIMLSYALISYLRIHRRVREAVKSNNDYRICDRIASPFILGVFHPEIYLPSAMDGADCSYVLSHEKAHLKRKDYLWKPLGFLLLSVYWFNPVLWIAYILLCRDIELACDEKVIKQLGAQVKKPYSEALISCSVQRRMVAACPLAFGEVAVKERVKSVLNYKKPAFLIIIVAVVTCIIAAVCLLTNPVGKYSLPGEYTISQGIYCDGVFSYYMTPETAPDIEIDKGLKLSEQKSGEFLSSRLLTETELTQDNFGSLINGSEIWQNDESTQNILKQNKAAWIGSLQTTENGVFPYMILWQKDAGVYIVYANVTNGKATCIRWIYTLEPQEEINVEIDSSLAVFLDTTIASHHETPGIAEDAFVCVDYRVLGMEKSGSEIAVYMWVLYQEYSFDGELHVDSASHTPTVVTVSKTAQADGLGYELNEYWEPRDGSHYADDIKGKFPQSLQRKALDSQWCIDEQEANCLKKAQDYYSTSTSPVGGADAPADVTTQPTYTFDATVLEINSQLILVQPADGSTELKSSDKISFSVNGMSSGDLPKIKVGDKVRITYDGQIAESYPAQLLNVYAVQGIDESGEAVNLYGFSADGSRCYTFNSSAEPVVKPSILLSDKGNRFQFTYSALSSYIAVGNYELTDDKLTLKTDDGKNTYVFSVKGNTFVFDASKSSEIPKYSYSSGAKAECPVPDGAIFE